MMFGSSSRQAIPTIIDLEPFDISLYATEEGLRSLQQRFSLYLRGLVQPARFIAFQTPANLAERIFYIAQRASRASDAEKRGLLHEYRRFYEILQAQAHYQRSECSLVVWADPTENPTTLARCMT
jgi:hypothetical protein